MTIKKFQGKTEEEALEQAKAELGTDVVLMSTKVLKKGLLSRKPKLVEVTVAKEEEPSVKQSQEAKNIAEAVASIDKLRKKAEEEGPNLSVLRNPKEEKQLTQVPEKLDNILQLLQDSVSRNDAVTKTVEKDFPQTEEKKTAEKNDVVSTDGDISSFLKLLYRTMIEHEIAENYANQMIEEISANYDPSMDMEYILSNIYTKMIIKFERPQCITVSKKGPKVVFFIGPTGVGKTTTLAKLASQLCLVDKKKVVLFTQDTYRIAAADQLNTYAKLLNIPCHAIYSTDDMKQLYTHYKHSDFILVDTAGHAYNNEDGQKEVNSFLHALDGSAETEIFLVLSITTKYKDLLKITDMYKSMANYKLVFTKLDETNAYGNMLNIKMHTGAPLSYVTYGQEVPKDISKFSPQETVKKLLSLQSE
ncbi:MAG: flagellar biosynthesis protein FlhF [Lachnospiraceae bacterium]|nr:flagellar biosynthesis protein FlhF [Lachnospiraceae bacterium]